MPIATPEQYAEMLDTAKAKGFAFPAFNVSSSQTLNAVLQGLTEAGSDGIIQVTTGGADYSPATPSRPAPPAPSRSRASPTRSPGATPITVALHTDHCPKPAFADFVFPLIEASEAEVKAGRNPIFQSHMWDGSAVPLDENLQVAAEILPRMKAINAILEVEIGVVGGEEDGVATTSTGASTRPSTTRSRPSRRSASASRAATWPPSRSATCAACTRPAT